MAVCNCAYLFI